MTMVSIPGGLFIPRCVTGGGGNAQTTQTTIDADAEGAGMIIIAPRTGDIQEIAFATQTVTTGGNLDCRIETVDTATGTGFPTGTLFGTNTNVLKNVLSTDDNAWILSGNLTANASVTKGVSKLAVIVQRPAAGAFNGAIKTVNASFTQVNFPYGVSKTGASWAKGSTVLHPLMAIKYSDGVWEHCLGCYPFQLITSLTVGTGTSPDEVGNVFQLPFKYRAMGCWVWIDAEATNSFTMSLYDNSDTSPTYASALASVTVDSDQSMVPGTGYSFMLPFSADVTVAKDTIVRLALKADTATTLTAYRYDFFSSTFLGLAEGGEDIYYTSRADESGTFADVTTQRLICGLVIDQIDDGDGSGGGSSTTPHWIGG